jgi:hypothetical protein
MAGMSQAIKPQSSGSNIAVGLLCLAGGVACLYFGYTFWAWFLFAIGTYALVAGVLQPRLGNDKATNIGTVLLLIVVIIGIYFSIIATSTSIWSLPIFWALIVILGFLILFGMLELIKSNRIRVAFKSLGLVVLSATLFAIFDLYAQNLFLINAVIVYIAMDNLRRGLHDLFMGRVVTPSKAKVLFFLPDAIVLALLIAGFAFYHDQVFFHMLSLSLVLALFRFSTETFIPEIAIRERQKLDKEPTQKAQPSWSFFMTLTGIHSSVNLLMIPLLLGMIYLPIDKYLAGSEIQSIVFQVSIGLIGIIVAFSTLILSGRLSKSDEGYAKQTYLLSGLLGTTLLFIIITLISFIGLTLKESLQPTNLPLANEIVSQFLYDRDMQIKTVVLLINEFVFFAVPAALLYFFSLNQDLMERFDNISQ